MSDMDKIRFTSDSRGVAAVEFAFIAPIMLLLMFGIICFSVVFSTYNAVQQLAAEAARAGLAGLSATEQNQLAQNYVTSMAGNYPFINVSQLTVTTASQATTFQVTISYNMSGSFFWTLGGFMTSSAPEITRSAAIQLGGF